jgi:hypothetical protein
LQLAVNKTQKMTNPKSSNLCSHDFDLFWQWLTYTKDCSIVAKKAENIKIIRVFNTLGIFKSNAHIVAFVKSWDCENEHTVVSYELKIGLSRLSAFQFQKFHRFILALQVKDRKEKAHSRKTAHMRKRKNSRKWRSKRGHYPPG